MAPRKPGNMALHRRVYICNACGEEYTPVSGNQRWCSPECAEVGVLENDRGRFRVLERDEFRCVYCGMSSVEDATRLHVDHIIPRAVGGKDVAGNLVTACARCNLEKGPRLMSEENTVCLLAEVERRNCEQGTDSRLKIRL